MEAIQFSPRQEENWQQDLWLIFPVLVKERTRKAGFGMHGSGFKNLCFLHYYMISLSWQMIGLSGPQFPYQKNGAHSTSSTVGPED